MDILQEYFDTALDSKDGIKKLREMIITLAMKGKLVPQDPADQSASELIKEIQAEKAKLIKDGKIKKQKDLPPIKPEEIPYQLPKGWEWVRLGDIVLQNIGGGTPSKQVSGYWDGDINWASVKDINTKYLESTLDKITIKGLENSSSNLIPKDKIIIVVRMGLGKLCINKIETAINQDLRALDIFTKVLNEYTYNYLKTVKHTGVGLTVKGIKQDYLMMTFFPLPPLAEQKRIVEKIDSLMAKCDELEKLKKEREQKRLDTHKSAIRALLNSGDIKNSWQFIKNNFSELYTVKENVAELRKAILQLAMMGKLVPQNPADQPASELIKEIQAEKNKLLKSNKKNITNAVNSKLPQATFPIPISWLWIELDNVCSLITQGPNPKYTGDVDEKFRVLKTKDFYDNIINYNSMEMISKSTFDEFSKYTLLNSDIIFGLVGKGSTAKCNIIEEQRDFKCILTRATGLIRLTNKSKILPRYIHAFFKSNYGKNISDKITDGSTGQLVIKTSELKKVKIPLPPLAEQTRIVAKIDSLMTMCDKLEKQITESESKKSALLNSLTAQV